MNSITKEQIEALVSASTFTGVKLGEKTTVLLARLPNGFEIAATSACIDPANYKQEIGEAICKERIVNMLWQLEGYRLQSELAS